MDYSPIKSSDEDADKPSGAEQPTSQSDNGPIGKVRNLCSQLLASVKGRLPDTSALYLQPLDPSTDISMGDRARLIGESIRPWREFFNLLAYNLPPFNQISPRVGRNIQNYFYNYFVLTLVHIAIFTIFHFGSVFYLAVWLALIYYLYIRNESDIHIGQSITIDENIKFVIAVASFAVLVIFGNVFTLVWSVLFFWLIVVGIHSLIRDDVSEDEVIGSI